MNALNLNTASFARVLGVSDSTVRNYFDSERNTKPGYEVLERLYHSFGTVNLPWLFGAPGEPLLSDVAEDAGTYQINKKIRGGQVIGRVGRDAVQNHHGASTAEQAMMQRELELLRSQLADKERTIQILLGNRP